MMMAWYLILAITIHLTFILSFFFAPVYGNHIHGLKGFRMFGTIPLSMVIIMSPELGAWWKAELVS